MIDRPPVTDEIEHDSAFVAGFTFARKLSDPEFRAWLKSIGYPSGASIYPAAVDTPMEHLMNRIVRNGHESGWIAYRDEEVLHGFRMLKFTYPKES